MVERTYAALIKGTDEQLAANIPFKGQNPANGSTGDDLLKSVDFTPAPNPLWAMDQPNYHWRFYLESDDNSQDTTSITIAETGVTGFNIQEVKMETFVGPNLKTKNTIGTNVTIKIFEPFGSKLPDRMIFAATELRIKNYYKCPWKLSLKFQGYETIGVPREMEELGVWGWDLMLTNVTSQITESGSVHTIEAIPFSEVALLNQYAILPVGITATGSTVGEVLQKVIDGLNDDQRHKYGDLFTEYAIEDRPYVGENISGITSPFQHKITAEAPQNNDERNAEGGQYSPGTDIASIVDGLFASSDSAVSQAVYSRSIDPNANQDEIKSVVSLMHRVETITEIKGFDRVVGDYKKKITYVIKPFDSLRLMTNVTSAESYAGSPDVQNRKLAHAKKRFLLQKAYDFIFTGKNTDVEKFDISLNFRWQVAVPQLYGTNHYGTATNPREQKENNDLRKLQGQQGQLQNANNELQKLKDLKVQHASEPPQDPDSIGFVDYDEAIKTQTVRRDQLAAQLAADKARDAASQVRTPAPKPKSNFAEDLVAAGATFSPPITILQDGENTNVPVNWGTSSHANAAKSVYGTLLNQLYGTFDANLLNIELTIRGDPYWLGPDRDTLAANPDPESSSSYANFANGEHMFVFRFKLPQGVDPGTGVTQLSQDETYTGFYAAVQITHVFSGGEFKQIITANRIPAMTVGEVVRGTSGGEV